MKDTIARIAQLLTTRYQVAIDPNNASFTALQLRELELDSLSLLSFLADVEREFRLRMEELEQIARRDCTLGSLSALCLTAKTRGVASSLPWPSSATNAPTERRHDALFQRSGRRVVETNEKHAK